MQKPESSHPHNEPTVFIISTTDIAAVQGTTEAYYISRLFATDFETHVFAPLSSKIPDVESHSYPFSGIGGVLLLNIVFLPYWLYVAWKFKPDIIYGYQNTLSPLLLISQFVGATSVIDFQDDIYDQTREFSQKDNEFSIVPYVAILSKYAHIGVIRRIDIVITLSEPLKEQICNRYRISERNVFVVPLGVDSELFHPVENDNSTLRIAYVGSIASYRGLDTVIEALLLLPENIRQDITFEIYGGGDSEVIEDLQTRARAADPPIRVHWHGYLPHNEIPDKVASCDLAISPLPPLRSFQVSCPAKIFEYLAMGLPIIATRIRPHETFLTDGEDAIFVEPEDTQAYMHAIKYCLNHPKHVEDMSRNARKTALDHDWRIRYSRVKEILRTHGHLPDSV